MSHARSSSAPPGTSPPGYLEYEALLGDADPLEAIADPDERVAAAMCHTTGTTGQPKGVLYSHRALVLHAFAVAMPSGMGVDEPDAVLPVVPMFHANAWGLPVRGGAWRAPGS